MSPTARIKLDDAVAEVHAWGAVLDMLQAHMANNANAARGMAHPSFAAVYRVHMMSPSEVKAFDFILTRASLAADSLRIAYDAANP